VRFCDNRLAPIFHTVQGGDAYGVEDMGSIFGEALIRCLNGGAGTFNQATQQWSVTVNSLSHAISKQLSIVNRKFETAQECRVSEIGPDAALHRLDRAPPVSVEVTLNPPEKREHAKIFVFDEKEKTVFDLGAPVPDTYCRDVDAGNYEVGAVPDVRLLPEGADLSRLRSRRLVQANPPTSEWPLHLE
jgi:hypothetical protein